jgi:hypothetical protein
MAIKKLPKLGTITQSEWVREYLSRKGSSGDFVSNIWKAWNEHKKKLGFVPCSYVSFRKIIYNLHEANEIVRLTDTDSVAYINAFPKPKVYYAHPKYYR